MPIALELVALLRKFLQNRLELRTVHSKLHDTSYTAQYVLPTVVLTALSAFCAVLDSMFRKGSINVFWFKYWIRIQER